MDLVGQLEQAKAVIPLYARLAGRDLVRQKSTIPVEQNVGTADISTKQIAKLATSK